MVRSDHRRASPFRLSRNPVITLTREMAIMKQQTCLQALLIFLLASILPSMSLSASDTALSSINNGELMGSGSFIAATVIAANVAVGHTEVGLASFYHDRFQGRRTANGDRFDQNAYSAAHRTLPFGTKVKVTRVDTGRSVVVTINDRGPFKKGRVVDLSRQAARDLDIIDQGLARVKVEIIELPTAEV